MILKTSELVEMFGNDNHKKSYSVNKKLAKNSKDCIIRLAKMKCNIVDIGNGVYEISELFKNEKPKCLIKNEKGSIYYNLYYMIIEMLSASNIDYIYITKFELAKRIYFVNENFTKIKNNPHNASSMLKIDKKIIEDFYSSVSVSVSSKIDYILRDLEDFGILKHYTKMMLVVPKGEISENHIKSKYNWDYKIASIDETSHILKSEEECRTHLNIKNRRDCFYGSLSSEFRSMMDSKLHEINVIDYFDCYEIHKMSSDKMIEFLSWYDEDIILKDCIRDVNLTMINNTNKNAKNRASKSNTGYTSYRDSEDYICGIEDLSDMTLNTLSYNSISIEEKSKYIIEVIESSHRGFDITLKRNNN